MMKLKDNRIYIELELYEEEIEEIINTLKNINDTQCKNSISILIEELEWVLK